MTPTGMEQDKIVFFGAGMIGQSALNFVRNSGLRVDFFVDNNVSLWGGEVNGLPVYSPEILRNPGRYFIIVTTNEDHYCEVKRQLSEMEFVEDQDFWNFKKVLKPGVDSFGTASGVTDLATDLEPVKSCAQNKLGISGTQRRVCRYIAEDQTSDFERIFDRCVSADVFGKYIVDTWPAGKNTEQRLCFEHEFIPLLTYAVEWPPVMFYDYTLFMIDFLAEIDRVGLGWRDAHPFNAAFNKGKFVFFDFDAVRLGKTIYYRIQEFINYHVIILMMMAKNLMAKAYLYLNNGDPSVIPTIQDISGYLSVDELNRYREMENACQTFSLRGDIQSCCTVLREFISNIQLSQVRDSIWNGYQNELYKADAEENWSDKQKAVMDMIRQIKPKTLLDLAGNMGWYEFKIHSEVERCIVADLDYNSVNFVYQHVTGHKIENVYPVYLNLIAPTPAFYKDTPIGNTAIIPWRRSAIDRLKSELVLALAIVHHLAFSQQLSFEEIIGQFALYTNRWLIIEFMEREDLVVAPALKKKDFDWYTQERFEEVLCRQFSILSSVHSEPTRILYLCEKKNPDSETY